MRRNIEPRLCFSAEDTGGANNHIPVDRNGLLSVRLFGQVKRTGSGHIGRKERGTQGAFPLDSFLN